MAQGIKIDECTVNNIKADYLSGYTYKKLSAKYNISEASVSNIVKNFKIKRRADKNILKDTIVELYTYSGSTITLTEIAQRLGVSRGFVSRVLTQQGIKTILGPSRVRKLQHNPFIDLNNVEVQYWLGWLASDGNVCTTSTQIYLGVKHDDINILEKFNLFINAGHSIKVVKNNGFYSTDHSYQAILTLYSKDLKKYLIDLGITPRKSLTLKMNIPLTWDFVRGYFDGNGWASISKTKNRPNTYRCTVGIATGSPYFKDQLTIFYDSHNISYTVAEKRTSWEIRVTNANSIMLLNTLMYQQSNNLYLARKKERIEQFLMR